MRPICVPCQRFMHPKKNGFAFIEGMPKPGCSQSDIVGVRSPGSWQPYKVWSGDLWDCPDCGAEVIVGCGLRPLAEHYQDDFGDVMSANAASFQVNDC